MKPLLYVMSRQLINFIKALRRKPGILIMYIVFALFFLALILSAFLGDGGKDFLSEGSVDTYGVIVTAILLFTMYTSVNRSIKSGSSFFRMADVNLAFTAPLSPKKVLLYGFIKQMGTTLLYVFFLVWQLPNLRNLYNISVSGMLILLGAFFFLMFLLQIVGLLIYSWTSRSHSARTLATRIWNGIMLVIGALVVVKLMELRDLFTAAKAVLNAPELDYIPILGWFKVVLMAPIAGITSGFYLSVALIVCLTIVVCLVFYAQKTDYYEDVLANTEQKEALFAAKREGKRQKMSGMEGLDVRKGRKVKQSYGGKGASAIFYRHMLEYRKRGFFLISRSTLLLAVAGFASQYFLKDNGITVLLFISLYYLFIMLFQGVWVQELERPFIYLLPASSAAKLFYATLADLIKNGIDGLVLFGIAGAFLGTPPLVILLCALSFTLYGLFFTYSDVLFRRLFGPMHSKVLQGVISMFSIIFLLAPGIILALVLKFTVYGGDAGLWPDTLVCLILIGYNLLVVGGIFAWARGIFDQIEMK